MFLHAQLRRRGDRFEASDEPGGRISTSATLARNGLGALGEANQVRARLAALVDNDLGRDIARIEIQALMGTAGIGVATWDAARGWVGSVQRGHRAGASEGEPTLPGGAHRGRIADWGKKGQFTIAEGKL